MKVSIREAMEGARSLGAKTILLQLPDGLKPDVFGLFKEISSEFNVIVSSDPFYGACDIGTPEVYNRVDAIIQVGHSEMPNIRYPRPVFFVEARIGQEIDIPRESLLPLKESGFRRIGLLCSIQYIDLMKKVATMLPEMGMEPVIGRQDARMKYPGQVIGCNFSAAHSVAHEVDCFIVVSTGKFHGIGVQLATDKPVFILDMNTRRLVPMKDETDTFLRKRYARISRALSARKICVVVDTKIGQFRIRLAKLILSQLHGLGIEGILCYANDIRPSDYENMRCDAVVFTGCPRVSIDDEEKFKMPILTPVEFQILFGFKKAGRYIMDEIVAVDDLASDWLSNQVGSTSFHDLTVDR
ncbi:MAG: diphthamide biosynthesis enzyme Dph2 [Thermoplasmataceae archaeon]